LKRKARKELCALADPMPIYLVANVARLEFFPKDPKSVLKIPWRAVF
jgi:hypothetical protein